MKKAVITTGAKQYLVSEGQILEVELLRGSKEHTFEALLIINDDATTVGTPVVEGAKITAETIEAAVKADKVTAIRYKPKKRVHKVHGHRQQLTRIKITKIA